MTAALKSKRKPASPRERKSWDPHHELHPVEEVSIRIANLSLDSGTQTRARPVQEEIVCEYAGLPAKVFPPVEVVCDGVESYLVDGFHRVAAARERGEETIRARVRGGSQRDAILASLGANQSHGLRRTNADKRAAAARMVADLEWGAWSDRRIAETCGVHHSLVAAVRADLSLEDTEASDESTGGFRQLDADPPPRAKRIGRDGKARTSPVAKSREKEMGQEKKKSEKIWPISHPVNPVHPVENPPVEVAAVWDFDAARTAVAAVFDTQWNLCPANERRLLAVWVIDLCDLRLEADAAQQYAAEREKKKSHREGAKSAKARADSAQRGGRAAATKGAAR